MKILIILISQVHGFDLQCEFEESQWRKTAVKLCETKNVVVTSPDATVTSVNGLTAEFYVNENVRQITISEQTLNYIPKGLEKFFPNLEMFHVHYSKLQFLTQADLKSFPQLFDLSFHDNELTTLDSNLLEFNEKVRFINLNDNKLKQIGANFVKPLNRNFEQINMQGNPCINDVYYPDDIEELVQTLKTKCAD